MKPTTQVPFTSKRFMLILTTATILLSTPFIAMQFTAEVDWTWHDFAMMGMLLFGSGLLCELVMIKERSVKRRIVICGAIMLVFFLVWLELAVGLFGTPFAGA